MEPKYVTFEQARYFNYPFLTDTGYSYDKAVIQRKGFIATNGWINRPEQHQVVDWLLEKHGIFIEVFADDTEENHNDWIYWYNITMTRKKGECRIWIDGSAKDSPKEAYSAAFDYLISQNII